MSKILPRFPQWISPRILLPVANLGEIPSKIAPGFLPPWICSSARILVRFAVAFLRDFGRRDYCFPARILTRFAAGSRRDFGHRIFSSRWESWRDSRQDPGEILAAGIFEEDQNKKVSIIADFYGQVEFTESFFPCWVFYCFRLD